MILSSIIEALRARCPSFCGRIGGAAEFARLAETSSMDTPCAYVIPADETVDAPLGHTGYRQIVHASFGVVIVVDNVDDERGQAGYDVAESLKAEVFKAILCWAPASYVNEIFYSGSSLADMDRSRVFYQLDFGYDYQLTTEDTYQPIERDNLGKFDTADIDVVGTDANPDGTKVAKAIFTNLYDRS